MYNLYFYKYYLYLINILSIISFYKKFVYIHLIPYYNSIYFIRI